MQTATISGISNQEKITSIMKILEQGVKEVFESTRYKAFLSMMSRFHRYSFSNVMLILLQLPESTNVAGFGTWKSLGRSIKKGSVGIRILAPMVHKLNQSEKDESINDDQTVIHGFRSVSVFDVSQTEGTPLPTLGDEPKATCDRAADLEKAIITVANCPVEFADLEGNVKGFYDPAMHRIVIKEGLSDTMRIKVLCHELCHSRLDRKEAPQKKDRETKEVIAESTTFAILQFLGVETSSYSFSYIANWSKTQELKELSSSLSLIQKESDTLIKLISEQLA